MGHLHEIDAIKRLKYRYFRCLDTKCWNEIAECFVEDATCAYGAWKFKSTGYERTYEEVEDRADRPSLKLTRTLQAPQARAARNP